MLDLAAQRLQSAGVSDRVTPHHGDVHGAEPAGLSDGASCLLTFHFVCPWRWRSDSGSSRAPLVAVHLSVTNGAGRGGEGGSREARSVAVALCNVAARARDEVATELAVLAPEEMRRPSGGGLRCADVLYRGLGLFVSVMTIAWLSSVVKTTRYPAILAASRWESYGQASCVC